MDMAKLVVITKGLAVSSYDLGADWVTIGRADGNTFQLVAPSVSGRHCEVRVKDNELIVRDLLSTNGTFIGGKKISEGMLKPGEILKLGDVELSFENSAPSRPVLSVGAQLMGKQQAKAPAVPAAKPVAAATPSNSAHNVSAATMPAAPLAGAEPGRRFHVLLVDDSLAFLEAFSALCETFSNNTWEVHSAPTADRALAILQEHPIDLAVLDIGMPMVDGIQLLGIVHRRYPGLKIAVMTGNATENNRSTCLANGAELFIEKPVSSDGTKVVFNLLHDLVSWAHREGFSGALRQVGLQEVVQMECIGGHSSILEIRNPQMRGQIYIESGTVTHAVVGTLSGKQAFCKLLCLRGGEFQVKPFEAPEQRTVQERWELLLMDAARVCDEETVMITRADAGTRTAPPAVTTETTAAGDDFVVVATYDGKWIPTDGRRGA